MKNMWKEKLKAALLAIGLPEDGVRTTVDGSTKHGRQKGQSPNHNTRRRKARRRARLARRVAGGGKRGARAKRKLARL